MKGIQRFIHQWAWLLLISFCFIGLVNPIIGVTALICMLAPVGTAFFKGRLWCGNFCPRGSFHDIVLSKLTLKRKIPFLLRRIWFKTVFLLVLMSAFIIQLLLVWGNGAAVGQVFVRMVIITTLLAILLGIIYNPRTWCLICPMGTLAHLVAELESVRKRLSYVSFTPEKCTDCKLCNKNCPISIDVHSFKKEGRVTDGKCLKCQTCVAKCPRKSLYVA